MTKRRASLKGKGVDILLGGKTREEPGIGPPAPRPKGESIGVPAGQPYADTPASEWTSAAASPFAEPSAPAPNPFAEPAAYPAAPNPFAEPAAPVEALDPLLEWAAAAPAPAPQAATAYTETALAVEGSVPLLGEAAAETPGGPVAEEAVAASLDMAASEVVVETAAEESIQQEALLGQPPTPEATALPSEDQSWLSGEPAALSLAEDSLPPATPVPDDPTLMKRSARLGGLLMSMPVIPHPESFHPETELTQTDLSIYGVSTTKPVVSEEVVMQRIGPERIAQLSRRIDELYTRVTSGTIADVKQASEALMYLRRARDKELEDQRQYDEAEYLVNIAQYMVSRAANVRQWSYTYGVVLLIYGLIWLAAFAAALVLDPLLVNVFRTFTAVPDTVTEMAGIFPPYNTIMWGGIGGVLGLLYSLFKHVAVEQDFDRQFVLWYIVQPFMGVLMGAIVHLLIVGGFAALMNAQQSDAVEALAALLAIAAAFRQNYVYAWLESVLKAFDPSKGGTVEEQKTELTLVKRETETETGPASPEAAPTTPTPRPESAAAGSEPAGVG